MHSLLSKIIRKTILPEKKGPSGENLEHTDFEMAKGFRELKINVLRATRDVFLIALGIASAAFGLEGFLLPSKFIDGGATGISLLISETTGTPLYALVVLINIPFVFLGYKIIGKQFAIKTALAITGLAFCIATFHFPEVTHDKLLVAVFGGFFLGAGIGLAVRGGAVIDGTEVLAIYLSKKFGTTIGDIIVFINIIIFSAAA
ncbi:MAG: YitT family protein, partial [Ferruginibacter sp.]